MGHISPLFCGLFHTFSDCYFFIASLSIFLKPFQRCFYCLFTDVGHVGESMCPTSVKGVFGCYKNDRDVINGLITSRSVNRT